MKVAPAAMNNELRTAAKNALSLNQLEEKVKLALENASPQRLQFYINHLPRSHRLHKEASLLIPKLEAEDALQEALCARGTIDLEVLQAAINRAEELNTKVRKNMYIAERQNSDPGNKEGDKQATDGLVDQIRLNYAKKCLQELIQQSSDTEYKHSPQGDEIDPRSGANTVCPLELLLRQSTLSNSEIVDKTYSLKLRNTHRMLCCNNGLFLGDSPLDMTRFLPTPSYRHTHDAELLETVNYESEYRARQGEMKKFVDFFDPEGDNTHIPGNAQRRCSLMDLRYDREEYYCGREESRAQTCVLRKLSTAMHL